MNNLDYKHINEVCKFFHKISPTLDAMNFSYFKDGFFQVVLETGYNSDQEVPIPQIYINDKDFFAKFKEEYKANELAKRLEAEKQELLRQKKERETYCHFLLNVVPKIVDFIHVTGYNIEIGNAMVYWENRMLTESYSIEGGLQFRSNLNRGEVAAVAQELQNFLNQ